MPWMVLNAPGPEAGGVKLPRTATLPFALRACRLRRTAARVTVSGPSSGSQTSPRPSPSRSACAGSGSATQSSDASQTPSASLSPPPPTTQTPAWQVSGTAQVSPEPLPHGVPSATGALEQRPVAGSQEPLAWQSVPLPQTTGSEPTHTPAWQASVCMQ
jgi:hypothetical protein